MAAATAAVTVATEANAPSSGEPARSAAGWRRRAQVWWREERVYGGGGGAPRWPPRITWRRWLGRPPRRLGRALRQRVPWPACSHRATASDRLRRCPLLCRGGWGMEEAEADGRWRRWSALDGRGCLPVRCSTLWRSGRRSCSRLRVSCFGVEHDGHARQEQQRRGAAAEPIRSAREWAHRASGGRVGARSRSTGRRGCGESERVLNGRGTRRWPRGPARRR